MNETSLSSSYDYCQDLARRLAGNFYPAFRLLPQDQRQAMCAFYAFMRIADDISDETGSQDTLRLYHLELWRQQLDAALAGHFQHPIHAALADTVKKFAIPPVYLQEVIDGVAMDLALLDFENFEQLRHYCYRVASAVGLSCIHIWGFSSDKAKLYAEEAGLAFQLTNILRDLAEDAQRGRVYLPGEDLARFGYSRTDLFQGIRSDAFRALMRFEVARARDFFESSRSLIPLLQPAGRAVFLAMSGIYRELLESIERQDYDVFRRRISVPKWRKAFFVLKALPTRFFGR